MFVKVGLRACPALVSLCCTCAHGARMFVGADLGREPAIDAAERRQSGGRVSVGRDAGGERNQGSGVGGLGVGVGGRFGSSKFYRSASIARVCEHLIVTGCCIGTSDRSPGVHGEGPSPVVVTVLSMVFSSWADECELRGQGVPSI